MHLGKIRLANKTAGEFDAARRIACSNLLWRASSRTYSKFWFHSSASSAVEVDLRSLRHGRGLLQHNIPENKASIKQQNKRHVFMFGPPLWMWTEPAKSTCFGKNHIQKWDRKKWQLKVCTVSGRWNDIKTLNNMHLISFRTPWDCQLVLYNWNKYSSARGRIIFTFKNANTSVLNLSYERNAIVLCALP